MEPIRFFKTPAVPVEMHKARVVQNTQLLPLAARVKANKQAGNNAHLLRTEDVFLDMLTDSGTNAIRDKQLAAMMEADDAYAGSASFFKLEKAVQEIFDLPYFLPAHQGRACEHLLARVFVKPGTTVPMNYHFTTTKVHIKNAGGELEELIVDAGIEPQSNCPFKGDIDLDKLKSFIQEKGESLIPFVRIEAGTNLIGGQPVSLENMQDVAHLCRQHDIKTVLDASLLSDNVYFNQQREAQCTRMTPREIIRKISSCFDIIYFSARKLTSSRGGGMCFRSEEDYLAIRDLIPVYEGFSTYGGISVREIECMAVGLQETLDENFISQGPIFIEQMVNMLQAGGVPVVTPAGGLGVHLDAARFVPHVPAKQYPAAALACALYLVSGIRGTERGTLSEERDENGEEVEANVELLRLALPRRVFTLSQISYAVDRILWLHEHRDLIGGLRFVDEPKTLRFFFGKLEPVDDWQTKLINAFESDLGDGR